MTLRLLIPLMLAFLLYDGAAWAQQKQQTQAPPPQTQVNPYQNVPLEYLQESDDFYRYCEATPSMRQYYNCPCIALKFLDERIARGPSTPRDSIMQGLRKECLDASEASAYRYQNCIGKPALLPPGTDPLDYCECYAKVYGQLFEATRAETGTNATIELQSQAHSICSNPETARRYLGKP